MKIIRYTLRNVLHTPLLALGNIFVILLLVFFMNILLLLQFFVGYFIRETNERLSLQLYLKDEYIQEDGEVLRFVSDLKLKGVGVVTYISERNALEILSERDNTYIAEMLDLVENENPITSSILITHIPLSRWDSLKEIVYTYSHLIGTGVKKNLLISPGTLSQEQKQELTITQEARENPLTSFEAQYERISSLVRLFSFFSWGVGVMFVFFLVSVAIVIYNSVGNSVFAFREEIKIAQLVGGQDKYIFGPFRLQGMAYTFLGAIGGILIFFIGFYGSLYERFPDFALLFQEFLLMSWEYFVIQAVFALIIGGISGSLAARKFLTS